MSCRPSGALWRRTREHIGESPKRLRAIAAAALMLAAAACSMSGIVEFEAYKSAFDKTHSTAQSILDQLAVQERALFLKVNKSALSPVKFNPSLARYFTDSVDPPGTASFRAALDTIKAYNDLLYGLETGQTAEAMTAKISSLESSLVSATNSTAALFAAGAAVNPQVTAALTSLDTLFKTLLPFIQSGLKFRSRKEFQAFLIDAYPTVRQLLVELRAATAVIFPVLTAATVARSIRDASGGALTADETSKIDAYRKLLADWVILIEASIKALDQAKTATEAGPTIGSSITGLTAIATEMDTVAQSARKHLAELATK